MAENNESGKKGFAGLDSLVSEVEVPKAPSPDPIRQENVARSEVSRAQPQPAYTGSPTSGGSSGKWWLIAIGVVGFFVWAYNSGDRTPEYAPAAEAPAPEYAPAAEAPAPEYVPDKKPWERYAEQTAEAPAPEYAANDEEAPPAGNGRVFNHSQIKYCLSEKIRISAWEGLVDEYSETSVDAFNAAVNDYNLRCSNFRYRAGSLESVSAEVEANRYALTLQGEAKAAANP